MSLIPLEFHKIWVYPFKTIGLPLKQFHENESFTPKES